MHRDPQGQVWESGHIAPPHHTHTEVATHQDAPLGLHRVFWRFGSIDMVDSVTDLSLWSSSPPGGQAGSLLSASIPGLGFLA